MKSKLLIDQQERTFALVFDSGEDPVEGLQQFAKQEKLTAASLTAIGALQSAQLGWFNVQTNEYEKIAVAEQVEVLALVGNISESEGRPKIHVHVVLGKRDGTAHGGHLLEARVRPTLEVMIAETPPTLRRKHDPQTNLALIDLDA